MTEHFVIIGAGQAGFQICATLRKLGFTGRITLVGEENLLPYERPPLSKAYLAGDLPVEKLYFRKQNFYEKKSIELALDDKAVAVDARRRLVTLKSGRRLEYDKLALATGAAPRTLPIPGADHERIHKLHSLKDSNSLRDALAASAQIVIIGAGFIGLEVAAHARKAGCNVTVVEALERPLSRLVCAQTSQFMERLHRGRGVNFAFGAQVSSIEHGLEGSAVHTGDGARHEAHLVVAGVGSAPNTALAENAGLKVSNGVEIDAFGRTSDPDIFAAGDCAGVLDPSSGEVIRFESVPAAVEQGVTAAHAMLGATKAASTPWFWTEQFDVRLQIAGLSKARHTILRREYASGDRQTILYVEENVLKAADAINCPADFTAAKSIIELGCAINVSKAVDAAIPLAECVPN